MAGLAVRSASSGLTGALGRRDIGHLHAHTLTDVIPPAYWTLVQLATPLRSSEPDASVSRWASVRRALAHVAGVEPGAERAHALRRGAMGEGLGRHVAARLPLDA